MVNAQPPLIEESGHSVKAGHDDMGGITTCGYILRPVFEADLFETVVDSPVVDSGRRSGVYGRLNERNVTID